MLTPLVSPPLQVLARLWQQLHEVCAKFDVKWHCPCGDGDTEQGAADPPGGRQVGGDTGDMEISGGGAP